MCTLIAGLGILGPGSVLVAANRDEDPTRPSDPPCILQREPRVVGGRDRIAGGTWLAIRERCAVVAVLNRRPDPGAVSSATRESHQRDPGAASVPLRSRGLLATEVAGVLVTAPVRRDRVLADAAREQALAALRRARFAPFSLAYLSPAAGWALTHQDDEEPKVEEIPAGWHALTHADLDDVSEPRTARLLGTLAGWKPRSLEEARRGLIECLRLHGDGADQATSAQVCIHDGPMITVSSSVVGLTSEEAWYGHAEGRPCECSFADCSVLLGAPRPAAGRR